MSLSLNTVQPAEGSKRNRRRVGRGIGSGLGKTAGRGHKGQKSRSGGFHKVGFEGGQMPLQRRLPKRGFKNIFRAIRAELNVLALEKMPVDEISLKSLREAGLVGKDVEVVRVIGTGVLTKQLSLNGLRVSKGARLAITQAAGTVVE